MEMKRRPVLSWQRNKIAEQQDAEFRNFATAAVDTKSESGLFDDLKARDNNYVNIYSNGYREQVHNPYDLDKPQDMSNMFKNAVYNAPQQPYGTQSFVKMPDEPYMSVFQGASGERVKFDTRMYHVINDGSLGASLKYNSSYIGPIRLPEGMTNASYLFEGTMIQPGCYFEPKSENDLPLAQTTGMFKDCVIGENVVIDIDTHNVSNMHSMFEGAEFKNNATLGSSFDTRNVRDMARFMSNCKTSAGFTLPEGFTTRNTEDLTSAFSGFKAAPGFTFVNNDMSTDRAISMMNICTAAELPENCKFGPEFQTAIAQYTMGAFDGMSVGDKTFSTFPNLQSVYAVIRDESKETPLFDKMKDMRDKSDNTSRDYNSDLSY